APETTMATAITAYNTVLWRRLRSVTGGVDTATDGVIDGDFGTAASVVAGRLRVAARSAISASGSISSSWRTSSWYRRACFTAPARSPAAASANMSFFVASADRGSEFA